jgi:phosphatidylinositol kinase/protein kinase (PI-3  family)
LFVCSPRFFFLLAFGDSAGQDFNTEQTLSVEHQVSRLVEQAMLTRNLCQGYFKGWCPFY